MSFEFVVHECWLLKEWWKRRHVTEDLKNHKNDSWSKKKQWIKKREEKNAKKKREKKKQAEKANSPLNQKARVKIKSWSKAKKECA